MSWVMFITNSIALGVCFLYGCIGETITEKVGNLNLGTPGIMCLGALGGCIGVNLYFAIFGVENIYWFFIILIPLIMCIIFAAIGGLIYAFLTVTLQANQNVTGLILTTFGVGFMKLIGSLLNHENYHAASEVIKKLFVGYEKLGVFGEVFLSYGFFVYLAIILAILASIFMKKTRIGLFMRSVGESPKTADAQGINISLYKYLFIIIGAAITGIGGLYFVMDNSGGTTFTEAPLEAYGWLAVALVIFSVWKPYIGIFGSIAFGALYILPQYINVSSTNLKLFDMFPYLVTIIVLILTSIFGGKSIQPPESLGVNYFREDR